MRKSYKFRIYPTKSQETKLENTFSMCRYLYNWSLAERNEAWEKEKRSIGYLEQQNKLPTLKEERPWFKDVYSLVLQDETDKYLPNNACVKAGLNKSISDVGWYKFLQILNYKALGLGKQVVAVDPKMTSQQCSMCGIIVKKSLSTRTHQCSECGFVAHRDHNAAINILRLGLESLESHLEAPTIASA